MRRECLKGKTIVITGASSGIGRCTAKRFAELGASLVLAARREAVLEEVAHECEKLGALTLVAPTDVTDAQAVKQLAEISLREFGRIDVWVNNAGAGVVGKFWEVPIETHDQVIRTNLLGYLHGAHAVIPHFFQRRKGVLVNVNSLGGWVPAPYAAAYSASKFGLRGYSAALRGELRRWPEIRICDVFPAFIDTPGLRHAGNYTGRELKPLPPVYGPERVARAIVSLAQRPRDEVAVGESAVVGRVLHAVAPSLVRNTLARITEKYLEQAPAWPVTDGNLFQPPNFGKSERGGFTSQRSGLGSFAAIGALAVGSLVIYLANQSAATR